MSDKLSLHEMMDDWNEAPGPSAAPATLPVGFSPIPQSIVDESFEQPSKQEWDKQLP